MLVKPTEHAAGHWIQARIVNVNAPAVTRSCKLHHCLGIRGSCVVGRSRRCRAEKVDGATMRGVEMRGRRAGGFGVAALQSTRNI